MSRRCAIAVSVYMLLGLVLRMTYGTYHGPLLLAMTTALALFASSALRRRQDDGRGNQADSAIEGADRVPDRTPIPGYGADPSASMDFVLALMLLASATMLLFNPLVIGASCAMRAPIHVTVLGLAAVACLLAGGRIARVPLPTWLQGATLALGGALLIVARIQTIHAAPSPGIDVFVTNTMACDYLLHGQNPYSAAYPDVYDGKYGYAPGFFYWPAYLVWVAPFRAALGDIRYGIVAADALTAVLLAAAGRKLGLSPYTSWLLPLVWLAHPVSLLVVELAWVDPVLVMGVAALAYCLVTQRWPAAGVVIGLVSAAKQYGALVGLLTLVVVLVRHRRAVVPVIATASATWLAMLAPYILLDARAFYERTVAVYVGGAVRTDALSFVALAKNVFGADVPGPLLLMAYLAIVAASVTWLARRRDVSLADWAAVNGLAYGAIFLLGKQAFCNYYYFVTFFLLVYVAASLAQDARQVACRAMAVVSPKSHDFAYTPQPTAPAL